MSCFGLCFLLFCVSLSALINYPKLGCGQSAVSRLGRIKMLDRKAKQRIINKFRVHEYDTGSTQVQIAILTEEIKELTEHLKKHKHDFSSRRGLLRKVGERRRLLKYLQKENEEAFKDVATKLKLKIAKKMIEDEELKRLEEEQLMAEVAEEDEEDVLEDDKEKAKEEE